jgi:hypothetical protein
MAIQAALVGTKGSGSGTLTTGAGTTTTGSTFVIGLSFDATASVNVLSDSKGNTYTQIGTTLSFEGHKKALYRCENGTGGASHTAQCTFTASSFGTIYLVEVTGAAAASFDQTAQGTDAASPYTVTTPTLSQANEAIITLVGNSGGNNPMNYASSNTTVLAQEGDGGSFWTSAISKTIVAATTAFTPSWTHGGSAGVALITATFKEASGAVEATAAPAQATETVQGKTPTLATERLIQPTVGTLSAGGLSPSALSEDQIAPTTGALQMQGQAPTLTSERLISPSVGLATVGALSPTVTGDGLNIETPGVASIALTGLAPSLLTEQVVTPGVGQIIVRGLETGGDASFGRGHVGTGRRWHGKANKYEVPEEETVGQTEVFPAAAEPVFEPLGGNPTFKPLESFPVGVKRPPYVVPPELLAESRARIAKRRRAEEDLILKLLS